jgi:hypothetical protein
MVKVHCTEGVANHSGPESCAVVREGGGEALTGVRIGQPLSRENGFLFRTPTRSLTWKAIWASAPTQALAPVRRGLRTWHVRTLLAREPGDLGFDRKTPPVRNGKVRSQSR